MSVSLRLSRGGSKKRPFLELWQQISELPEMEDILKDLELIIR